MKWISHVTGLMRSSISDMCKANPESILSFHFILRYTFTANQYKLNIQNNKIIQQISKLSVFKFCPPSWLENAGLELFLKDLNDS